VLEYKRCVEGYTESKQECSDWRDDGYNSCQKWGENCTSWAKKCVVSWIPIIGPAICKVFEWVCKATEWVCVAAVWVAQWVCHAWKLITTFVCLVWETIAVILYIPGIFIKAILSIPVIGALIRQIINLVVGIVLGIIGFIIEGIVCGLLGICLAKKLRVCVIILHDDRGAITTQAALQPILDRAKQIYKAEANINVYFEFDEGPQAPNVEPECGGTAWLQDLGLPGTSYEFSSSLHCRGEAFSSVIGLASPIYAFAARDIAGSSNGCSLWLASHYIVFEAGSTCVGNTHLAHEMGHCCGLLHTDDPTNLMNPDCVNPGRDQISGFQKSIVRGSKYVTYF
jgi:hypothetical protein